MMLIYEEEADDSVNFYRFKIIKSVSLERNS